MNGRERRYTAGWTTSPQRPSAGFAPNWSEEGFADQTIRQTVRLSIGGDGMRVRLSNRYGTTPLRVTGLTASPAAKPEAAHELTKDGKTSFIIPAGAELATDEAQLPLSALAQVTVMAYLAQPSGPVTYHAQALATSYRAAGDHRADTDESAFTETSQSWYFLAGVDVTGATGDAIVVFGDSLVDGTGGTPDTNQRFPDLLAERIASRGLARAVLNHGIGGNRVTVDSPWLGDRATARFPRDVLTQPGVSSVVVLVGINDIGISELAGNSPFAALAPYIDVPAEQVIAGHRAMIAEARAAGLRIIGATLLPIQESGYSTPRSEAKRSAINTWIRDSGEYDAVIDLARAMGDALDPDHDSGDHLHPNDAGYRAMADATDLSVL